MAHLGLTPKGVSYAHDAASNAYDDQMRWIDALDTKAGILIAADGVIVSLVMAPDSALTTAPAAVAVFIAVALFSSLVMALVAFSTRRYEIAPDVQPLVEQMQHLDDNVLKWIAIEGLTNALEINESKVNQKAGYLVFAAVGLLLAILVFAFYFVYSLF